MHEVLVNRLGGLSLPRKSVVRLTDRPDMTLDVYRGRKTTIHSVHRVLNKDLSMNKVCARWIPRLLTENEKERRVVASREFLLKNQRDPTFLDRIITVDETWLHYYDPEDKRQSCVWKTTQSPPPKKAKVTKSMGKNMFIVFLDRKGLILCHSVPHGETVNSAYYSKVRLFVYTHCKWFMYNFRDENVCIYFKYRMFDRLLHRYMYYQLFLSA